MTTYPAATQDTLHEIGCGEGDVAGQTDSVQASGIFRDLGFFWWLLALLVGTPSIIHLVQSIGFERDLVPPLQMIIDGYGQLFAFLGMLVEPWAVPLYRELGELLGWTYEPHVYWRAIFVILMLYPISVTRLHVRAQPWAAMSFLVLNVVVVLAGSLAFGFAPARANHDAALIAGIAVFVIGKTLLLFGVSAKPAAAHHLIRDLSRAPTMNEAVFCHSTRSLDANASSSLRLVSSPECRCAWAGSGPASEDRTWRNARK